MTGPVGTRRGEEVLLCPGPVILSPAVRAALTECQIGHRDTRFSALMQRLRRNARPLFRAGDEHSILFIGGPATAAIESVCASLLPHDAHVIVPVNGTFGARIAAILEVHGIAHTVVDFGFAQPFDLARIEAAIAGAGQHPATVLATAHHETSAGILNPVTALGEIARRNGLRYIVDATSSAGVEDLDVIRDGIDACITASGKCLHAAPGVGLVCVRRAWLAESAPAPARTYSLDLRRFHAQFECNAQTPFTPPVPLIAALDRALEELEASGGAAERRRTYARRRNLLAAGLQRLGLSLLPLPDQMAAHSILTVEVPACISFDALYAGMKGCGYLIYACKPPLGARYFQLAVMGDLRDADLAGFLSALSALLDESTARHHAALG
ncbi:MAG TPA: aminotransferase class V-fold PLP-dependent enzyme [Steroidobacteraceae bacterium]